MTKKNYDPPSRSFTTIRSFFDFDLDLDIDLDHDEWLGKKEVSFSGKLLLVIGSWTSIAGLFPMALDLLGDVKVDRCFFVWFSIVYFVSPIALYLLWTVITGRIVPYSKRKGRKLGTSLLTFIRSPITFRYSVLLIIHTLLICIYVAYATPDNVTQVGRWKNCPLILLLMVPTIVLIFFLARRQPKGLKKSPPKNYGLWTVGAIACTAVFAWAGHITYTGFDPNKYVTQKDQHGKYSDLATIDSIRKELDTLESRITNQVDRFYMKSRIQYDLLLGSVDNIYAQTRLKPDHEFSISSSLRTMNKVLLDQNVNVDPISDTLHVHHKVQLKGSVTVDHELFIDPRPIEKISSNRLLSMMHGIDHIISAMMDSSSHRIYPCCLESTPRHGLLDTSYITKDDTARLTSFSIDEARFISAKLNKENSERLKKWVEGVYLPYCQKKAKWDITGIAEKTHWVWVGLRSWGTIISLTTLLLLIFFFLDLLRLKSIKLHHLKRGIICTTEQDPTVDQDDAKRKIEELNKKCAYLFHPLTTTISVIGLLFLLLISGSKIEGYIPSRSFWLSTVPSLHLPAEAQAMIDPNARPVIPVASAQLQASHTCSRPAPSCDSLGQDAKKLADIAKNLVPLVEESQTIELEKLYFLTRSSHDSLLKLIDEKQKENDEKLIKLKNELVIFITERERNNIYTP